MNPRQQLRQALDQGKPVVAPVCLDPLSARLIQQMGFPATYLGGGALGFTLAVSEALLTMDEVAGLTARVCQRVDIPVVVDGGIGFGDPLQTMRTIWAVEQTGAAAIEIEDQVAPKRAHHHRGVEHLISKPAMVEKIRAAVDARRDPDFLIIARTNAVKNEGMESAVERIEAYRAAGADVSMLLPRNLDELREVPRRVKGPLAYLGRLGERTAQEYADLGYSLIIDAMIATVVTYRALRQALTELRDQGRPNLSLDEIHAIMGQVQETVGMTDFYALEERTTEKPA